MIDDTGQNFAGSDNLMPTVTSEPASLSDGQARVLHRSPYSARGGQSMITIIARRLTLLLIVFAGMKAMHQKAIHCRKWTFFCSRYSTHASAIEQYQLQTTDLLEIIMSPHQSLYTRGRAIAALGMRSEQEIGSHLRFIIDGSMNEVLKQQFEVWQKDGGDTFHIEHLPFSGTYWPSRRIHFARISECIYTGYKTRYPSTVQLTPQDEVPITVSSVVKVVLCKCKV